MKHFIGFVVFLMLLINSSLNAQVNHSKIYKVVDEMPVLPSCKMISNHDERKSCSDTELMKYVKQNLHYSEPSGDNNVSDLAIVEYVVSTEGRIIDTKVIKNTRGNYANELIRVLHKMNEDNIVWTPGRKGGEKVMVKLYFSMRFKMPAN